MCFSAEASFVAGAVLVPGSLLTLRTAWQVDRRFLGFATFPLFFGIQQFVEGGIWLAMDGRIDWQVTPLALVFLFFAYWVWPFLVPFSAYLVEDSAQRRQVFAGLSGVGFLYGLFLFGPVTFDLEALKVTIVRHSIHYRGHALIPGETVLVVWKMIYAAIICGPLLTSTVGYIRRFGVIIAVSVLVSFVFASYAFTSIWCFMAAVISAYMFVVFHGLKYGERPGGTVHST